MSEEYKQAYTDTYSFYSEVFNYSPPADIWENTPNAKAIMRAQLFRFVNVYRLATMYCMKQIDPNFMKPQDPPVDPN